MSNQMLTASLGLDASNFHKGTRTIDSGLRKLSSGFTAIGVAATAAFAVAAVGITKAVRHASDFEFQMARVQAIVNPLPKDFGALRKAALDMSVQFGKSAPEAAQGLIFLGQAGFSAKESISALPGAFDLAAVAGLDLATSADTIAVALRTFNIDASKAGDVASVFAYTQSTANTNVTDMAYALKFAGPIMSALGISIQETSAAIGVMADSGIRGSMAGTSLRGAFSKLLKPTGEAKEVVRALGIELKDHEGKMKNIAGVIEEFERLQLNETEILQLVGVRAAPAFLAIMNGQKEVNGEVLQGSKLLRAYTKEIETHTDYAKEGGKVIRDTLSGAWDKLSASVGKLAITFVEKFRNPLNKFVVGPLRGMIDGLDAWLEKNKTLEKDTGAFFETLTTATRDIEAGFKALGPGIEAVVRAMFSLANDKNTLTGVTGAFREMAEKYGPELPKKVEEARRSANAFYVEVKQGLGSLNDIARGWKDISDVIDDVWFVADGIASTLAELGTYARFGIGNSATLLGDFVGQLDAIGAEGMWEKFKRNAETAFTGSWADTAATRAGLNFIKAFGTAVGDGIGYVGEGLGKLAAWGENYNWSGFWSGLGRAFNEELTAIKTAIDDWVYDFERPLRHMIDRMRLVMNPVQEIGTHGLTGIAKDMGAETGAAAAKAWVGRFVDVVKAGTGMGPLVEVLKKSSSEALKKGAVDGIKEAFGMGPSGAVTALGNVANSASMRAGGKKVAQSWTEGMKDGFLRGSGLFNLMSGAQFVADNYVGWSPPKKGPLSLIDVGGANVAKAWGEAFTEELAKQGGAAEAMASRIQRALALADAGKLTMGGTGEGTVTGFVGDFRLDKEQWIATFDALAERSTEFSDNFNARMESMILGFQTTGQIWSDTAFQAIGHIQTGFESTLNAMIFGGQTIGQVWKGVFKTIVQSAIANFAKMRIQALITALFTTKVKQAEGKSVAAANTEMAATAAAAFAARLGPAPAKIAYTSTKSMLTAAYMSGFAMSGISGLAISGGGEIMPGGAGGIAGQGHDGLNYVPSTGTYLLKQGEMVATPNEANALRTIVDAVDKGSGGAVLGGAQTVNVNVTIDFSNIPTGTYVPPETAAAIGAAISEQVQSGQLSFFASRSYTADSVEGLV